MNAPFPARPFNLIEAALRAAIVGLTLATASIHATLGGLLFTMNAVGYVVLATAMVAPLEIASRFRWIVRIALVAYAATTIIGWAIQGPFYSTAYVAKAIEVALIVLLTIDFVRFDGNPLTVIRRELRGLGPHSRRVLTLERLQGLASRHGSRHPRPASSSSPTSPATRPTSREASWSTRRRSPVTCSRRSSAASTRRSGWPSSRVTRRSCSSRTAEPTGRCCRRHRGVLPGVPAAAPEHRPGDELRLQLLPPGAAARPQAVRPPRLVRPDADRGTRRARRIATSSSSTGSSRAPRPRRPARTGFALFTARAVDALGLDPERLGLSPAEESIEHLGRVATFTLDLEARWQAESRRAAHRHRRGRASSSTSTTTVAADPAVVWAHLTSPALRTRWEGPIVIDEASVGGRRGVGTDRHSA